MLACCFVVMNKLTLEDLPSEVGKMQAKIDSLHSLVENLTDNNNLNPKKWMDLAEFRNYHPSKPSLPTVYRWLQNGDAPGHKKGKKWYFLKSEVDEWLKEDEPLFNKIRGARS